MVEKMSESVDIDEETEEMCCPDAPEHEGEKKMKCVIKMRCPEGEDAEKIKEKVLMRLGKELGGRSNVVMTRLNDEDLKKIDALVEVEAFKSRSEAAAFFIKEGVQARQDLFQKVTKPKRISIDHPPFFYLTSETRACAKRTSARAIADSIAIKEKASKQ